MGKLIRNRIEYTGGSKSNVVPNPQGTPTDTLSTIGFNGIDDYYLSYGLIGSAGGSYVYCPLIKSLVNDLSYRVVMYDNTTVYTSAFIWKGSTIVLNISGFQLTIQSTQAGLTYYGGAWRNIYCDIYAVSTNPVVYSISGGGGSGGHTIVDDAGTDLTQRTNLQFKGAYSEDNSTDDTTEVNVVREMTKAEFDLLSDDEKVGFINITDITGGNDDRFQPVIYSEEEREIGVWTDGKPLYQKTIDLGNLPNQALKAVNHNISNLGQVIDCACIGLNASGTHYFVPYTSSDSFQKQVCFGINSTTVRIWCEQDRSTDTAFITIRYTKTTDTPGSGQWTPQGVPAVHYSTDEQVIGTWIDGKTLYARTIVLRENGVDKYTFTGSMSSGGFYAVGLTGIDKIWLDGLYAKRGASGDTNYTDIDNNSSEVITVFKHSDGSFYFKNTHSPTDIILTIRYTKTS